MGGMAELFKAKLYGISGFEKPMVLKQILPQYARNGDFLKMFIDEAKIAVQLSHGNIVPIYELGRVDNVFFIAMEFVDGKNLAQVRDRARAQQRPLSMELALYIAIEICKGLGYAHRQTDAEGQALDVVHRDISPPNIMVGYQGQVKITDFGIAKARNKIVDTHTGVLKGTAAYMSPEQAEGKKVNHRTDIFSLGTILYELLTGRSLFKANSEIETLDKVRNCEVPPPSAISADLPFELDPIVLKTLARSPADRYESCDDLLLDLSRILFSKGSGANAASLRTYLADIFGEELGPPADRQRISAPLPSIEAPAPLPIPMDSDEESDMHAATFAVSPDFEEVTGVVDRAQFFPPRGGANNEGNEDSEGNKDNDANGIVMTKDKEHAFDYDEDHPTNVYSLPPQSNEIGELPKGPERKKSIDEDAETWSESSSTKKRPVSGGRPALPISDEVTIDEHDTIPETHGRKAAPREFRGQGDKASKPNRTQGNTAAHAASAGRELAESIEATLKSFDSNVDRTTSKPYSSPKPDRTRGSLFFASDGIRRSLRPTPLTWLLTMLLLLSALAVVVYRKTAIIGGSELRQSDSQITRVRPVDKKTSTKSHTSSP